MINAETVRRGDAEIKSGIADPLCGRAISFLQSADIMAIILQRKIHLILKFYGEGCFTMLYKDSQGGIHGIVIIEVKATGNMSAVHKAQALTYLRLTNHKLGLVINFGQARLIKGY